MRVFVCVAVWLILLTGTAALLRYMVLSQFLLWLGSGWLRFRAQEVSVSSKLVTASFVELVSDMSFLFSVIHTH